MATTAANYVLPKAGSYKLYYYLRQTPSVIRRPLYAIQTTLMKLTLNIFVILLLSVTQVCGQRNLTKDEILKYWNSPSEKNIRDSTSIVNSDSSLNARLLKFVDSLNSNNVDSVLVFSTAYPGYSSSSKCDTGILFPITTYIIWNSNGVTNIRKIKGNCMSDVVTKSSLHLFDFYNENFEKLSSEIFMPVIFSGKINKDKTISYSGSWVDHEPCYSFYYKVDNFNRSFHFSESYIENKESLFHDFNLDLAAYHWWLTIKKELKKFE